MNTLAKKLSGCAMLLWAMAAFYLIQPSSARAEIVITNNDAAALSAAVTNGGLITISNVSGAFTLTQTLEIITNTTIQLVAPNTNGPYSGVSTFNDVSTFTNLQSTITNVGTFVDANTNTVTFTNVTAYTTNATFTNSVTYTNVVTTNNQNFVNFSTFTNSFTFTNFVTTNTVTFTNIVSFTNLVSSFTNITTSTNIIPLGNAVISGNNAMRVFHVRTNAAGTNLLTLLNIQVSSGLTNSGAGVFLETGCTLIASNCTFGNNHATNAAGHNGANATVNLGEGGTGGAGGATLGAAIFSRGTLTLLKCLFTNNIATAANGGNGGQGANGSFPGNGGNGGNGGAASGGAIYCSVGNTIILNTTFAGNECLAGSAGAGGAAGTGAFSADTGQGGAGGIGAGGGIYAAGPLHITNCLFWENQTLGGNTAPAKVFSNGTSGDGSSGGAGLGAGIYVSSAATAEASVENCTFFQNFSEGGAGGNTLTDRNSTAGNGGIGGGAAIASARVTTMRNCTLATNTVIGGTNGFAFGGGQNGNSGGALGGNIYRQSGTFILINSILAKGTNGLNCSGGITDGGYNISSDASAGFTSSTSKSNLDPKLDTGLTQSSAPGSNTNMYTLALLRNSPAIDKIPASFIFSYPATDQRLVTRPQGTGADIGAYEYIPVGQISGRIRAGSLAIVGVSLSISNLATTNIIIVTNDTSGAYVVTNLDAGTYVVTPLTTNSTVYSPANYTITLTTGQTVTNANFEVIFLGINKSVQDLYNFPSNSIPRGLLATTNGSFIGTTQAGGATNAGTIFQYSGGTVTTLYSFTNTSDGANPKGGLILAADRNYYGTTYAGGSNNLGTLFRISSGGAYSNLLSFTGDNGAQPVGALLQTPDRNFYGTTSAGGSNNLGTVFHLSVFGVFQSLYSFNGTSDGADPEAALALGTNGLLYGTTVSGGTANFGTVFSIATNGELTSLHSFAGGGEGTYPSGPLTLGNDGNFYGTTSAGGTGNLGTIFKIGEDGTFANLHSFLGGDEGATPFGGLILGVDGFFYGTTYAGGTNDLGTVFRISTAGEISFLSFNGTSNIMGSHPFGGLIQDANGNIYGTTSDGGSHNGGVLFQVGLNPLITLQPINLTLDNHPGQTAVFSATVLGSAPLSFQWIKDSTNLVNSKHIMGATNASLTIANVTAADVGSYWLVVSNSVALVESAPATLAVAIPPTIKVQPVKLLNQVVGSDVSFKATAAGAAPLSYQWLTNGVALTDTAKYAGITTTNLTVSTITADDAVSYSLLVSNAYGVVESSSATLTIAADKAKPTILISAPAAGARTATPFLLGTAKDNARVTGVTYWLTNSHDHTSLTGSANLDAEGKVVNWSVPLTPTAGTNVLSVQATDYSGLTSAIVSRTFFYNVPSLLTLTRAGTGLGFFTGKAAIAGDTVPSEGALLNIGDRYTIQAVPDANSYFSNWTGTFATTNPTISFMMEEGLNLQATFTTNLFVGMTGVYYGLFYQTNISTNATSILDAVTEETAGMISGLIITSKGTYNGRLLLAGGTYLLNGKFDMSGEANNVTVTRPSNKGGNLTVNLKLLWDNLLPRIIIGSVSGTDGGPWTSEIYLTTRGTNAITSAEYTMLIPPGTNPPPVFPPGDGYALITNKNGQLTFQGKLADGTAFTQSVPLSEDTFIAPVYLNLYAGNGLLLGWLNFDSGYGTNFNYLPAGDLAWIKKPVRTPLLYTNGFTNVISVRGSVWTNPPAHVETINLTNGVLEISGGDLPTTLTFAVAVTNNQLIKLTNNPANSLTGKIDPKTGLLTVTFGNGNGKATTIATGAISQLATNGGGLFLGRTNTGSISLHR